MLIGASAGGHLALLAGLTRPKDGLDGPMPGGPSPAGPAPTDDESPPVSAVVNIVGPADFRRRDWPEASEKMLVDFLGDRQAVPQAYIEASPVTYARSEGPPVLSFYGTNDNLVPYSQAVRLEEVLQAAGERSQLVTLEGKDHGGDWTAEDWRQVMLKTFVFLGQAFTPK